MMERGTAHIFNNVASIETPNPPSPVGFSRGAFNTIVNNDEVLFQRSVSNPNWATRVVLASKVDQLLSFAVPHARLTRGATTLLQEAATTFVMEAETAPTDEQGRKHLDHARETMASIAAKGRSSEKRLRTEEVRSLLKPSTR